MEPGFGVQGACVMTSLCGGAKALSPIGPALTVSLHNLRCQGPPWAPVAEGILILRQEEMQASLVEGALESILGQHKCQSGTQ